MRKNEIGITSFYQMTFEEVKALKAGDEIAIGLNREPLGSIEFIKAKVVRPLFWNSDADEPDWELETNNGFVDAYSVWGFKSDEPSNSKSTRVVLSMSEVSQIIADSLISKGRLGNKKVDISWNIDMWRPENSAIVLSQERDFTITPGDVYYFYTTDSSLKRYNGTKVSVLRQLTTDECDTSDVGNMYKVRFEDGCERDAFEDELIKGRE